MSQLNTSPKASRKGGSFDPKREARMTLNFIGLCLHEPMTPEAKKNIQTWMENLIKTAYLSGQKDGITETSKDFLEILKKMEEEVK